MLKSIGRFMFKLVVGTAGLLIMLTVYANYISGLF